MAKRLLRFICLLGVLFPLLIRSAAAQGSTSASMNASVFVAAHQDDWQLFMGSRAYDNVQRHRKVVFIIITAGQGDQAAEAWWKAREQGCLNSARTAANPLITKAEVPTLCKVNVGGHELQASYYRNTVVYFLRLPDGGGRGQGFRQCSFQTLGKLRNGQISAVQSLDGSNQYGSWNELTGTVRAIIQREVRPEWTLWVHSPNPDLRANPYDHPDHISAGLITDAATRSFDCRRLLYVGYNTSRRPVNLNPSQTANQTAMFAAYCRTMTELGQPSGWQPDHLCWLGRQYSVLRHHAPQVPTVANAAKLRADSLLTAPAQVALAVPAPNPCTASSLLAYELPERAAVNLSLYDVHGQLIKTLVDAPQAAGHYEVWLNVNQFPAAGVYLCRLRAGTTLRTQRVLIRR